jgi:dipeptidyl-peptidase-4
MHRSFRIMNKRWVSFIAWVYVFTLALSVMLGRGGVRAAGDSAQADSARTNQTKVLTVERIYGTPNLSGTLTTGIEWSPDAKRISYFERDPQGNNDRTELRTMNAATGESKVLVNSETLAALTQPEKTRATQATGLGRIQPGSYVWSPVGKYLLFMGSSNLVLLDLKTMAPKPLVTGDADIEDPKSSPDGRWVSFVRDWNLSFVNVASGETKAITAGGSEEMLQGKLDWVYPEELDLTTAYWWSPDSSKIAFLETDERPVSRYPIMDMSSPTGAMEYTRFPQAGEANPIVRFGIVAVTGGQAKWMDTGSDADVYIARIVWLHDRGRVAIERLNRAQNRLDLFFCDTTTGASQTILTEADKYWINIRDDLYFFSDDKRFLWSRERSGFRHFYLYDLSGRQLDQLTSGNWGVTASSGFGPGAVNHPAVDEAHGEIYFLSNKDEVPDTQLYRVFLRDKSITRLTHEAGTHHVMIAPDHSGFEENYSNAATTPRQGLYRANGTRVASINANEIPELAEYHLSPPQFVNISAPDGTKLCAMTIMPSDFAPSRKNPVLIDVYGGPQVQNVQNVWGG